MTRSQPCWFLFRAVFTKLRSSIALHTDNEVIVTEHSPLWNLILASADHPQENLRIQPTHTGAAKPGVCLSGHHTGSLEHALSSQREVGTGGMLMAALT